MKTGKLRQITIGRAAVGANANLKSVSIEDLTVARLRLGELTVTDSFTTPSSDE